MSSSFINCFIIIFSRYKVNFYFIFAKEVLQYLSRRWKTIEIVLKYTGKYCTTRIHLHFLENCRHFLILWFVWEKQFHFVSWRKITQNQCIFKMNRWNIKNNKNSGRIFLTSRTARAYRIQHTTCMHLYINFSLKFQYFFMILFWMTYLKWNAIFVVQKKSPNLSGMDFARL